MSQSSGRSRMNLSRRNSSSDSKHLVKTRTVMTDPTPSDSGTDANKLLELVSSLYRRLVNDFDISTLWIRDYPNPKANWRFRAYLMRNGKIVSEEFNHTTQFLHAEEAVITSFLNRNPMFRRNLTKRRTKWKRILRSNAEECVQRRNKKVVKHIKVD